MRVFGILLLILLLVAAGAVAFYWVSMHQPYGSLSADGVFVEIPHGTSARGVAQILQRAGIIRSALAFDVYGRRHPKRSLEAGEYFFDHAQSGKDVFWKLANGEVYQQPFVVREGQTMFDIAHQLEAEKHMSAAEFLKAAKNPDPILDLDPTARTLEGFLFPATYNLPRHVGAVELTAMMVKQFREAMSQIATDTPDANVGVPGRMMKVVTLASLVERETPKADERPVVAGVYSNRLEKGMLLQCDPTVIYALEQARRYKGSLTLKDLRIDSPYNTYMHAGLPPGPIGNPGMASLRAALRPAQTPYLYFVANTQGGHFFAATLDEHNKNVAKYHRLLNGQSAEPPVVAPAPPAIPLPPMRPTGKLTSYKVPR